MKIAIYGRRTKNTNYEILAAFFAFLEAEGIIYIVHEDYSSELAGELKNWKTTAGKFTYKERAHLEGVDFVYSFGGDGTFLDTVEHVGDKGIPLLGVNFGRLGFLTTVMQQDLIEATRDLMRDSYKIDSRTALQVESNPREIFGESAFGLNDLTIHKSNTNEMITVHTYINGEFLNSYWGDGLIVATPTGSTAYSLSCGGPIIHPLAKSLVITPVAPHALTVRPVIIPDDYVISFEIESRSGQSLVALDTRTRNVPEKAEIAVRKADFDIKLVRIGSSNYLNNLRTRLMWGRDSRN